MLDVVNKRDWIYPTDSNPFRRCAFLSHFPSLFWDSTTVRDTRRGFMTAHIAPRLSECGQSLHPHSGFRKKNSRLTSDGSASASQNRKLKKWRVISGKGEQNEKR